VKTESDYVCAMQFTVRPRGLYTHLGRFDVLIGETASHIELIQVLYNGNKIHKNETFTCGLFNDSFSTSEYIASNYRITYEE
jgi:hypothetical protein